MKYEHPNRQYQSIFQPIYFPFRFSHIQIRGRQREEPGRLGLTFQRLEYGGGCLQALQRRLRLRCCWAPFRAGTGLVACSRAAPAPGPGRRAPAADRGAAQSGAARGDDAGERTGSTETMRREALGGGRGGPNPNRRPPELRVW